MSQRHLDCDAKDVTPLAMLVGDPGRAERAASLLSDAREINSNRGLLAFSGAFKGVRMTVATTMMGAPSAAIVMEELGNLGARVFLRLGSAGGFAHYLGPGDLVLAQAAIRDEGTSRSYLGPNFPAVADFELLSLIRETAAAHAPITMGIVRTHDAYYRDSDAGLLTSLADLGVVAQEMETSCVYAVAQVRRARAAALLVVGGNLLKGNDRSKEGFARGEDLALRIGLEALAAAAALPALPGAR